MLQTLTPQQLTLTIDPLTLGFADTSQLLGSPADWIGQPRAQQAAQFGLRLRQPGVHLLVLGEPGCGRRSLMLQAMQEAAARQSAPDDIVYVNNFAAPETPVVLYLHPGAGIMVRDSLDNLIRTFAKIIPGLLGEAGAEKMDAEARAMEKTGQEVAKTASAKVAVIEFLQDQVAVVASAVAGKVSNREVFEQFLASLKQDALQNIELFQQTSQADSGDGDNTLEALLSRYRANLLVDNRRLVTQAQGDNVVTCAPVIYDDDPSYPSLFGGIESSSDNSGSADFMRLRAGNLLRANGGMLLLHLRDLQADQQNGSQILEKLHRFLRNHRQQIEEPAGAAGHGGSLNLAPEALPLQVKVVLIATRDEYYRLQHEQPDFADFFRIKVDFADSFSADANAYQQSAIFIAKRCEQFGLKHFSAAAVASLLQHMQRLIEDQTRISANFATLQAILLESASMADLRDTYLIDTLDVEAAMLARQARHQAPEDELRASIVAGELMISVHGNEVGRINGLTHIDLGDSSFGSPVRISARCNAGDDGIINIDREVAMTGPNHDKGLFILRSWLAASFGSLAPLALNASLVFEQEYSGVEGDSASCTELYALLSALSGVPLRQGIAVTGALNQHGEVMAIGGINEKIEGYFKLCQAMGLDGRQGVLIPARNQSHLLLDPVVIDAVATGQFHIQTIDHVLDGIAYLAALPAGTPDSEGLYAADTLMGKAQSTLQRFRETYQRNRGLRGQKNKLNFR